MFQQRASAGIGVSGMRDYQTFIARLDEAVRAAGSVRSNSCAASASARVRRGSQAAARKSAVEQGHRQGCTPKSRSAEDRRVQQRTGRSRTALARCAMRAAAPSSPAAGNSSARSATPQAADSTAGSKSFSDMLVGTPARAGADSTPTATGGKPARQWHTECQSGRRIDGRARQGGATRPPQPPKARSNPAAVSTAAATATATAAIASPLIETTVSAPASPSSADDTDDADGALADAGTTRPAGRRDAFDRYRGRPQPVGRADCLAHGRIGGGKRGRRGSGTDTRRRDER